MRFAVAGSVITLLAGCSQDTSRFADPFSNPFAESGRFGSNADPKATASVATAAPVGEVKAAPLPPRVSALQPPVTTAAVVPERAPAKRTSGTWSIAGGTPIVVGPDESLASLSRRYGVPQEALLDANGLASADVVRPGTHLIVPIYNAAPASPAISKFAAKMPPARPPATIAAKPSKPVESNNTATTETGKLPVKQARLVPPAAVNLPPKSTTKKEEVDPTPTASLPSPQPPEPTASSDDKTASNPEFRWPVRGRVIQAFRSGANDGINIAVPEGTSVKAAENGTVVYAGSELKGYGNLVLIRHPNGFTTAYANNGEISVKRGDQVKRGQIIAKSGQSGNVASPQLHFELRKGSTPVDPSSYLAGL
jgi:murein DD-endopeptidase MepM/ murein hydrolase activator NlpD